MKDIYDDKELYNAIPKTTYKLLGEEKEVTSISKPFTINNEMVGKSTAPAHQGQLAFRYCIDTIESAADVLVVIYDISQDGVCPWYNEEGFGSLILLVLMKPSKWLKLVGKLGI